ncbi:hypothetical protein GEMRC1_005760 [Eukaryota sp. GEM-RC1]
MENFILNFKQDRMLAKTLINKLTVDCAEAVRWSVFHRLQKTEIITENLIQKKIGQATWELKYSLAFDNSGDIGNTKADYLSGVISDEQMQEIIKTCNEQNTQSRAQKKAKKRASYKARKKAEKQAKQQSDLYTNFHN